MIGKTYTIGTSYRIFLFEVDGAMWYNIFNSLVRLAAANRSNAWEPAPLLWGLLVVYL